MGKTIKQSTYVSINFHEFEPNFYTTVLALLGIPKNMLTMDRFHVSITLAVDGEPHTYDMTDGGVWVDRPELTNVTETFIIDDADLNEVIQRIEESIKNDDRISWWGLFKVWLGDTESGWWTCSGWTAFVLTGIDELVSCTPMQLYNKLKLESLLPV